MARLHTHNRRHARRYGPHTRLEQRMVAAMGGFPCSGDDREADYGGRVADVQPVLGAPELLGQRLSGYSASRGARRWVAG